MRGSVVVPSDPSVVELRGGVIVPVEALKLALRFEDVGITLTAKNGGDILATPADRLQPGDTALLHEHREALKTIIHYRCEPPGLVDDITECMQPPAKEEVGPGSWKVSQERRDHPGRRARETDAPRYG
jgi:hypothetical protein